MREMHTAGVPVRIGCKEMRRDRAHLTWMHFASRGARYFPVSIFCATLELMELTQSTDSPVAWTS